MPLVRIDLVEGRSAPQVAAISNAIQARARGLSRRAGA
jgi:hypothetical protein